ncbi:hypothetical protein BDD12DRAFT_855283, partial [Trichophaea hybrida]
MATSTAAQKRLSFASSDDESDSIPSFSHSRSSLSLKSVLKLPAITSPPADDDDEDDYMNMTIEEPKSARETLTQRQKRLQRESEIRSRPKSKAEIARKEKEKRAAALAKSIIDAEAERNNKGLKMMKMMGFTPGSGLGKKAEKREQEVEKEWKREDIRLEPIGVAPKEDRAGIGHATETKRKLEASGTYLRDSKRQELDPAEYRQRIRVEREEKRFALLFYAAQKVCEKLDMKRHYDVAEEDIGKAREVPLGNINVLWRGMVRYREDKETQRRMRYDMEQGLGEPRLPGYDRLHELDETDKAALGIEPTVARKSGNVFEENEGEQEDEELAEFEALSFEEKLQGVVEYLRKNYHYCFWCKFTYQDEMMEGCPGTDEDSH